jgi:hypothetical protein
MKNILFYSLSSCIFFTSFLYAREEHAAGYEIKRIRNEYYRLNKISLSQKSFSRTPEKDDWQEGSLPNSQVSAKIYQDKKNRIRKFFRSTDSGNVYTTVEEYFLK